MTTTTTFTYLIDDETDERLLRALGSPNEPTNRAWIMRNKAHYQRKGRTIRVEQIQVEAS